MLCWVVVVVVVVVGGVGELVVRDESGVLGEWWW
jgi:hypothetical protein